jgi:hypothetical protein
MRQVLLAFSSLVLAAESPAAAQLRQDVAYLASPKLKGRGHGSPGLEQAAAFLTRSYQELGVDARMQRYASKAPAIPSHVRASLKDRLPLAWDEDLSIQTAQDVHLDAAPLLFTGEKTDGLNLKGKVALVLRRPSPDPTFANRIRAAAKAGAAALLLVEDASQAANPMQNLELTLLNLDVPLLKMSRQAFEKHLPHAIGQLEAGTMPELGAIDLDLAFPMADFQAPNVLAVIPGTDPRLKNEYIALGAHFDHLGVNPSSSSLAKGEARKGIHPGADDNASGTALVLDLGRHLKAKPTRRSILLMHFSGEELGLLGSAAWAKQPTVPPSAVKFYFNFDMVGRLRIDAPQLFIGAVGATTADLAKLDQHVPAAIPVSHDLGIHLGASDHSSMAALKIPTVMYTTSIHADYHTPTDTADKINGEGMVAIEAAALGAIRDLADADAAPAFDPTSAKWLFPQPLSVSKAFFGARPGLDDDPRGLLLDEPREGSPAATAGLRRGDILTVFDGQPIHSLFDLNAAVGARQSGDRVTIHWIRNGKTQEATMALKPRE